MGKLVACSQFEVADLTLVQAASELLYGLRYLTPQHVVRVGDHFFVGHHVIIEGLRDDILGDHAANLCVFVKEWKINLIVEIKIDLISFWLPLKRES